MQDLCLSISGVIVFWCIRVVLIKPILKEVTVLCSSGTVFHSLIAYDRKEE